MSRDHERGQGRRRRRGPLSCREVVELVTDYLEGALSRADRIRFERHLAGCPHCSAYVAQMRLTIRAAGRAGRDERAAEVPDELVAAFRDWHAGQPDEE